MRANLPWQTSSETCSDHAVLSVYGYDFSSYDAFSNRPCDFSTDESSCIVGGFDVRELNYAFFGVLFLGAFAVVYDDAFDDYL